VTAITARISRADRERLLDRVDELRELDRLMREPGTLHAPLPARPAAHHRGHKADPTRKDDPHDR